MCTSTVHQKWKHVRFVWSYVRRKVHIAFDISCICSAIVHNLEGVWKNLVCLRACMCTYTVFRVTTCTIHVA